MQLTEAEKKLIAGIAQMHNLPTATAMAVIEVESAGHTYTVIDGRKEPLIRWEGHYFDKLVDPKKREQARKAGLASPKVGGIKNPSSQAKRYAMLHRAMQIDRDAAIMSCSWGVGQVMGSHWKTLGYKSAVDFYNKVSENVIGQVDAMFRYIVKFGLVDELQRYDWAGFARGYNGPLYAKYGYHTKLERAFSRYNGAAAPVSSASGMLRMGSKGKRVRELQQLLVRSGAAIKVDGDFGPATKDAVLAFQRSHGLTVDGVAGPETLNALALFRPDPEEDVGAIPPTEVKEVTDAAKGLGPVAVVIGIRDQVAELAYGLLGVEFETAQTVANVLLAGSSAIGVGLAVYAAYGWWKSGKTYEGVS
ncbi:N-acetylmuramidase domain-containing protein [Neoaquamicrobium sediminum]|uniref:N-acetylmuramidase domain-containing protein n=1 Tax=Neoaquamicrobium sediminum TaxID=1849104 RepID=UPI001564FFF5|nr:N-acetylmuramidase domain-containing protein [Mesorhizobium sediminum]NRC54146.1 DUF3380 domain-containing protein [Mesorhizobium sediminum]